MDRSTVQEILPSEISGSRREVLVDENCVFLGYYAACNSNLLPTFRDNLSVINFSRRWDRWVVLRKWDG